MLSITRSKRQDRRNSPALPKRRGVLQGRAADYADTFLQSPELVKMVQIASVARGNSPAPARRRGVGGTVTDRHFQSAGPLFSRRLFPNNENTILKFKNKWRVQL